MMPRLVGCTIAIVAAPALLLGQANGLPNPPPQSSQFDYLLGDWTFSAVWRTPNGERSGGGTWKAHKAFDGFGIVDEWRVIDSSSGITTYLGATVRIYSPGKRRWEMRYLNAFAGTWHEQYAEWRDAEMHLWWSGTDQLGEFQMRVVYYDITQDSFRWKADRSYDGGVTWIDNWLTMEVTRVDGSG